MFAQLLISIVSFSLTASLQHSGRQDDFSKSARKTDGTRRETAECGIVLNRLRAHKAPVCSRGSKRRRYSPVDQLSVTESTSQKRPYWPRIVAIVVNAAHRSIQTLTIHFHSDYERQTIYRLSTTAANYANLSTTTPNPHTTQHQHHANTTIFTSEKTGGSPACDWRQQHAAGTCQPRPRRKPIGWPWRHWRENMGQAVNWVMLQDRYK